MARIYKVNGYEYDPDDFWFTLRDQVKEHWQDWGDIYDKDNLEAVVERDFHTSLYEIEEMGEVVSYGKYDFWLEEE